MVNTGSKLVLIDAGTGGQLTQLAPQSGTWDANFAAAGFDPKNVDTILISHFHQDHINGLKSKDGDKVFTAGDHWWWVPVVAPCCGAVLGGWIYDVLIGRRHAAA